MNAGLGILKRWFAVAINRWDRFWFQPRDPTILCGIRIACGLILLYGHLVLASDLMSWLGPDAWIDSSLARDLHNGTYGPADASRSYLWWIQSPALLWGHHAVVIATTLAMTVGLWTVVTTPLAWFFQLMLVHRLTGALFGLDQIATYTVMYLAIAPCGAKFSIDAWRRGRTKESSVNPSDQSSLPTNVRPSVRANMATRLLQIHLCIIYLFGGLAKSRGETWWDGTAVWYSVANLEYQSIDMTWLANWPMLFSALAHATLFWEIFYIVLIWPLWTRPLMLLGAVLIHGGIACFLGMITFGLMMIIANAIFIPLAWIQRDDDNLKPSVAKEPNDPMADFQRRQERLRRNEAKYRQRVERLRQREAKLRDAAERRRRTRDESTSP